MWIYRDIRFLKNKRAYKDNLGIIFWIGWNRTLQRIVPVIIASLLIGIVVTIGMILLVLPGIVVAFFLMFTLVALMVDNLGVFKAIGYSFRTVGKNFGATFIAFLVIIGLAIITIFIVRVYRQAISPMRRPVCFLSSPAHSSGTKTAGRPGWRFRF